MKKQMLETKEDLSGLFDHLHISIFRYIFVRTGYNRERAEDMTQNVFLKAWEKREQYDCRRSSLRNWIYAIARNHVIDYYRSPKPQIVSDGDYEESVGEEETPLLDNSMDNSMLAGTVMKELKTLDQDDREVITLRYINEMSIKDIAEIINKSNTATKVMIHRALKKLKAKIETHEREGHN